MSREKKIAQYLREANSMEEAQTDVLASQIGMAPRGSYRSALQSHLRETRGHATRVHRRLSELDRGGNPLGFGIGIVQSVVGQALALARTPLNLLGGRAREERLLNDAKNDCATEAREIATYTAIERLARSLGDAQTAKLAASIRDDEQRMLDLLMREIPTLTEAVASGEVREKRASNGRQTRAAGARRPSRRKTKKATRRAGAVAKRPSSPTRSTPKRTRRSGKRAASAAKRPTRQPAPTASAPATEQRRAEPWPDYEERRVERIVPASSRGDLGGVGDDRYEREREHRGGALETAEGEQEHRSGALETAEREPAST